MPDLPSGTVTFLFTDIEGSTPLWEKMPKEMQASLAQHHAILRQAIEANGGQVVQVIGDAFQAAFRLAFQGLCAALDAQRTLQSVKWGDTGPIRVRMGLHTGSAELDPKGDAPYAVGHTLNRVARVMSAGHGGQILVSQEAKDLIERDLPEGVSLRDLGDHHLKGLAIPEHIYQVCGPGLAHDFPPLGTSLQAPNNLPVQLSSFVGRGKESLRVKQLVASSRLVSLTGAGGVGKTRLALRCAKEMLGSFPKGVWLVELAPVGDPALIVQVIATLFGLRADQNRTHLEALLDYLREKHLLLILDNCEHLIEGCAEVAEVILRTCPGVRLLATSREALGIEGESVFHVPSLSMPDPAALPSMDSLPGYEAIQLFCERAQAVSPDFTVTQANAGYLARICQRLDGIPLALELAAARLKILSPAQIAARLDDRFRLLTGGSRRTLPRHQTLTALIDWSYGLLSEVEQALFRCLSVFSGGWTLEAAEAVAGKDIVDLLTRLVDKSLVQVIPSDDGCNRFRMLETIRQYAQAKLVEAGEAENARDHHLDFYAGFAEDCEHRLETGEALVTFRRLRADLDNLWAALSWSLESEDAARIEKGLLLAGALWNFWPPEGHSREIIIRLEKGVEKIAYKEEAGSQRACAKADLAIGWAGMINDDLETIPYLKEGMTLSQAAGDVNVYVKSALFLCYWHFFLNDIKVNESLIEECLDLARQSGDRYLLSSAIYIHAIYQQDRVIWQKEMEASIRLLEELGNRWEVGFYKSILGNYLADLGQYEKARAIFEEFLETAIEFDNKYNIATANSHLGRIARLKEDYLEMERFYQASYDSWIDFGDISNTLWALNQLGFALLAQGNPLRAARIFKACRPLISKDINLFTRENLLLDWANLAVAKDQPAMAACCLGGLTASLEDVQKKFGHDDYPVYQRCLAFCRDRLNLDTFQASWKEGAATDPDQILDEMEATFLEGGHL